MAKTERIGRDDWIREALVMLPDEGISGVRVEPLASRLNVTKGSFYWHFKDRAELHEAMLGHWLDIATRDIMVRVEAGGGSGREKLRRLIIMTTAGKAPGRLETAIRGWAQQDANVARALALADRERVAYVSGLLRQVGLKRGLADLRAQLLYLTVIGNFFSQSSHLKSGQALWREAETLICGEGT